MHGHLRHVTNSICSRNRNYRIGWKMKMALILILAFKLCAWYYFLDDCELSYIRQLVTGECVYINETINSEVNIIKMKTWKSSRPKLTITLFTTFDSEMQQGIVYENTLRNWKQLANVETILFYGDRKTRELGQKFNWNISPVPKYSCGTPVLRSMFEVAQTTFDTHFYGYANADILFSSDLIRTLEQVLASEEFDYGPVLLTGKRIDINLSLLKHKEINSKNVFSHTVNSGQLSYDMAADYFITNQLFLWKYVPDLVIGRLIIDNWLIWYSRIIDSKIIDLTFTSLALHQRANGFVKKISLCNHNIARKASLLPPLPIYKGSIECCSHTAIKNSQNEIIFLPKSLLSEKC